jgi:alcohol dehydrogenase class IV
MASTVKNKAEVLIELMRKHGLKAPKRIVFGAGALERLGDLAYEITRGGKAVVIMGNRSARESGLADRIQTLLGRHAIQVRQHFNISREPTVRMVDEAAAFVRVQNPKVVIGVGGGSVIDCAKAAAALAANEGTVTEYLEGIGSGRTLVHDPLPVIAVPTASGAGAEMTKNAVITIPELGLKRSMRDERMIPTAALIDSELSLSVPPHITAAGGLDALSQLIEPCISVKRQEVTTELAHEGLRNVQIGLSVAYEDPGNSAARERMALVSMLGGVCLANAGLALAHGIAAGLGALHNVPHGLACGILLPHTLRYNRAACEKELGAALAAFLTLPEPNSRTIDDGIEAITRLGRWLQIPPDLKYLGLSDTDLRRVAELSMGSSMAGNPIPMTQESVFEFLRTIA